MSARVAIYYAPRPDDPLADLSAAWLGRDNKTPPELPGIHEITAEARSYGFHATLKPPMHLNADMPAFLTAAKALATKIAPFELPNLVVEDLRGFLALREARPCPPLQALADQCVERLDSFRTPPSPDELARRRKAKLTPRQDAMLVRWGYPYVFETWFFHMTLTRRLSDAEKSAIWPAARAWFAPALDQPRRVEDICLFCQSAPGQPFVISERIPLLG